MVNFKDTPLAAVAEKIVGPVGATILLVATAFSCFGNSSGDILATPRLLFAGANDGLFPKFLGRIHRKFDTPYLAIITYVSMIFIFAISGGFKQLAVLASAVILLIYMAVIFATIKLRYTKSETSEKTFGVPGRLIVPFIGIAAIVWMLSGLGKTDILSGVIFMAIVSVIYFVMKILKKTSLTSLENRTEYQRKLGLLPGIKK